MKWILIAGFFLFTLQAQSQAAEKFVKKMHQKYSGKWYRTLTFEQTTEIFRNDSLVRSSLWFEAARFPYDLRIDTDTTNGNGVIYSHDSTYIFREKQLKNVVAGGNPFMFFLGGMYFLPIDSVIAEFKAKGYDLSKSYETEWDGRKTFVIGSANPSDSTSNSVWIDTKELYVVRTIEPYKGQLLDARMYNHVRLGEGWSETKVDILSNGKLIQVENYKKMKVNVQFPEGLFNPAKAGSARWF